jgi:hypothetical protein
VDFPAQGTYTLSAWVNVGAANSGTHYDIISKHDRQYALKIHSSVNFEFFEFSGGWNGIRSPVETGVWKHVTGIANAGVYQLWVDGVAATETVFSENTGASGVGLTNLSIGKRGDNSTRFFNGTIDEVTISSVARSADWVRLSYQNQRAAQTLVSFTQPVSVKAGQDTRGMTLNAQVTGSGILFTLPSGMSSGGARLSIVDMWGRVIWSRTVSAAAASSSAHRIHWNGQVGGKAVSPGVYVARIVLFDGVGRSAQTLERKIPLTR